ncbi:MAG: hypothetical protein ORN25_10545, partial [Caulobacteraceae bacterium]|nr:hypothetical protein [Caulobacteraceae bacterium]
MSRFITVVEVGPRDGLQNESGLLEPSEKLDFIARLEACGVQRIETVSFVNPRRVPQMAGAEEIAAALRGKNRGQLRALPDDSRAFNAHGQLVDRWGSPLFFHAQS